MKKRSFGISSTSIETEDSLLNLTPLIDVVFVLLITFILIAPLLKYDRIELSSARDQKKEEQLPTENRNSITIRVYEDNSITINHREITFKELYPLLVALKHSHPHEIPILFHDQRASFGTYQMIKNSVESAGFEELDILLKP